MTLFVSQKNQISSPRRLKEAFSLSEHDQLFIQRSRSTLEMLLERKDPRILIVVGPCSLYDEEASYEYALRLFHLQEKVKDRIFIVMRTYVEKARSAYAWKGMINDPYLDGSFDIESGIRRARKVLINITEMGVPIAAEIVEPLFSCYFSDLLSLAMIGARTCSAQTHRQMASHFSCAVGFKNSLSGALLPAVLGLKTANRSHVYVSINEEGELCRIESMGNPYTFLVLRGGREKSNYDSKSIHEAKKLLIEHGCEFACMVDCGHDNSRKEIEEQKRVFISVIEEIAAKKLPVFALMLESFLQGGSQSFSSKPHFGQSMTDPCLSWPETEELILWAHRML